MKIRILLFLTAFCVCLVLGAAFDAGVLYNWPAFKVWAQGQNFPGVNSNIGQQPGQLIIGGPTGPINSGSPVYTGAFGTTGAFPTATTPCQAIDLAFQKGTVYNANGTAVDASGMAPTTLQPCDYATANFLGNAKSGILKLGAESIYVPLAPSSAGCITAVNACANGPNPPRGVTVPPNKFGGIEGAGRGDPGGVNSTIVACAATITDATCSDATHKPAIRNWGIDHTAIDCSKNFSGTQFAGGHRCYLEIFFTPFAAACTASAHSGSVVPVVCTGNLLGILSAGQTVALSGFTVLAASLVVSDVTLPTVNSSGNTTFNLVSGADCGVCAGTISIGNNFVPGEHLKVVGSTTKNNNFNGRVCKITSGGGVQQDPSCPAAPARTGVAATDFVWVVGYSADQINNKLGAVTTTACAASCGNVFGEIPIIDGGSNATNFQFNNYLKTLSIDCQGVPSCVPVRFMNANEESGFDRISLRNTNMWCGDFWTTNAQNASNWKDVECTMATAYIGAAKLSNCDVATTGFIFNEAGIRALQGATANFNVCPTPIVPTCGFMFGNTTTMRTSDIHAENVQFNRCYGFQLPSQGAQSMDNGGQAGASCNNDAGSNTNGPGCAAVDGPFATQVTENGTDNVGSAFVTCAAGSPCSVAPTGCYFNTLNNTGSLITFTDGNPETVQIAGAYTAGQWPITSNAPGTLRFSHTNATFFCSVSGAEAISGNYPLGIASGSGAFTGDWKFGATKNNTGDVFTIIDDISPDGRGLIVDTQTMSYEVDASGNNGAYTRVTTASNVPTRLGNLAASQFCNLGGATGLAAASGSCSASATAAPNAWIGKVSIAVSNGTVLTINTTAVTATSQILVQQIAGTATGITGNPTCATNAEIPAVPTFVLTAGVSFQLTNLANPAAITCFQFQIIN